MPDSISQARQQIQQQRQVLTQRRQQAQQAQQRLEEAKQSLPEFSQRRLRQTSRGLQGKVQRQQIENVRDEIAQRESKISQFQTELTDVEQGIDRFEQQVNRVEQEQQEFNTAVKVFLDLQSPPPRFSGIDPGIRQQAQQRADNIRSQFEASAFFEAANEAIEEFGAENVSANTQTKQIVVADPKIDVSAIQSIEARQSLPDRDFQVLNIKDVPAFSTPATGFNVVSAQQLQPQMSFARQEDLQPRTIDVQPQMSLARPEDLRFQHQAPEINVLTGKPFGEVRAADVGPLGEIKRFKALQQESGFFGAVPRFVGEEVRTGVARTTERLNLGSAASPTSRRVSQISGFAGEVGTFFTPLGPALLIGSGAEELATPSGRQRIQQTSLFFQEAAIPMSFEGKQSISGLTPQGERLLQTKPGSMFVASAIPLAEVGLGLFGVKVGKPLNIRKPTPQRTPLPVRDVRQPSFIEIQQPAIVSGKPTTFSSFAVMREVTPPKLVTSRTQGFLGGTIKPARLETTFTPLPVKGKTPFPTLTFTGDITKTPRLARLDIVAGSSNPRIITLAELKKLPRREQFLWQRLAESYTGGRPVKLENVPKILRNEAQRSKGNIEQFSPLGAFGKRTRRFETVSEFKKVRDTGKAEIFKGSIFFKDVTKPLARATGKTPELKGTVIKIKEPIVVGEGTGVKFIQTTGSKKTPLSKTFSKQLESQLQVTPKPVPKPSPNQAKSAKKRTKKSTRPVDTKFFAGATALNMFPQRSFNGKSGISSRRNDGIFSSPSSEQLTRDSSGNLFSSFGQVFTQELSGKKQVAAQTDSASTRQTPDSRQDIQFRVSQDKIDRLVRRQRQPQSEFFKPKTDQTQTPSLNVKQMQQLKLKAINLLRQNQSTSPLLKAQPTPKSRTEPKRRPFALPIPKEKIISETPKAKLTKSGKKFKVYVKRFGQDVLLGTFSTLKKAKDSFKAELQETLRASGFVQDFFGKKVKVDLGSGFRPGKKDPFRVVQKRGKRLGTRSEVKEIQFFKKRRPSRKSKKKTNKFFGGL